MELTAYLLASGIDPEQSILFAQSAVPRHAELCWLLACLATHARLAHLPQFKEKSATMKEVPIGLLLYPVLQVLKTTKTRALYIRMPYHYVHVSQAADVLVYRGTHVPVGTDQLQHLQVAAQLVRTFHHRYGRLFPTPSPILPGGYLSDISVFIHLMSAFIGDYSLQMMEVIVYVVFVIPQKRCPNPTRTQNQGYF